MCRLETHAPRLFNLCDNPRQTHPEARGLTAAVMNKPEYEPSRKYLVSGIEVRSEIVSDQESPEYRAFHIRSSCPSRRWGTRTLGFSLTCYKNAATDTMNTLESARFKEAERIIKIESGELPEGGRILLG